VALYHLGNNAAHSGIYQRALERPGVIVLHDAVLNHFLLGQLSENAYVEEFVYNYGEWYRDFAQELWRTRAGSAADNRYFEYPLLRRVAERALAVVVHTPAAARAVRLHAPQAKIAEIPHLFVPPPLPPAAEAIRFRQRLGVEPSEFLFGVFGYLRESKRLATVLKAHRILRRGGVRVALLVAGRFVSTDLERGVEPMLREPGVARLPYLRDREFWAAAAAVDACINLRYPAAGEASGITIRLMGLGKPVLVSDTEECLRFPEDACLRVATGAAELDSLMAHMVLLTSLSGVARAIGQRGAAHIEAEHRLDAISKQYWELMCDCCT